MISALSVPIPKLFKQVPVGISKSKFLDMPSTLECILWFYSPPLLMGSLRAFRNPREHYWDSYHIPNSVGWQGIHREGQDMRSPIQAGLESESACRVVDK